MKALGSKANGGASVADPDALPPEDIIPSEFDAE
jgi:hypothetical protein